MGGAIMFAHAPLDPDSVYPAIPGYSVGYLASPDHLIA